VPLSTAGDDDMAVSYSTGLLQESSCTTPMNASALGDAVVGRSSETALDGRRRSTELLPTTTLLLNAWKVVLDGTVDGRAGAIHDGAHTDDTFVVPYPGNAVVETRSVAEVPATVTSPADDTNTDVNVTEEAAGVNVTQAALEYR
jgi:hypothetical protein